MDNEIEISEFGRAKELYANPLSISKDLVEIYNKQLASELNTTTYAMDKNKVLRYEHFFDATGLFPLYVTAGIGSGLAAVCAFILFDPFIVTNVALTALGSIPIGGVGFFIGSPLAHAIYKKFDASRLRRYATTRNPKNRAFYTNRVLDGMLISRSKDSQLFNNHFVLAYALWLHESGRSLRALGKDRLYRKLFKNSNFLDFANDQENFAHYVRLAKDMNNGKFARACIPRIAQTDEEISMFDEYACIVDSRKGTEPNTYLTFEEIEAEVKSRDLVKWKDEREKQEAIDEKERKIKSSRASQKAAFGNFQRISIGGSLTESDPDEKSKTIESPVNEDASSRSFGNSSDFQIDIKLLKDIESEWFAIQSDIVELLNYPMLSDMSEPLVKEFHTRLSFAKSLSVKNLDNSFVLAVSNLSTSWNSLVHEAHKVEISKFSDGERKKIILAKKLIDIALNTASTPSERQSAYKKAMGQLQGLIVIPKSAIFAIEHSVSRPELVA